MKRKVVASRQQGLAAIDIIQRLIQDIGYDFQRYEQDVVYRSAIERQFEILGEAMYRVDGMDARLRYDLPAIGDAIGMRNMIAYNYDSVDNDVVWATILENLDPLRKAILSALAKA